jgi:hypothetical protein
MSGEQFASTMKLSEGQRQRAAALTLLIGAGCAILIALAATRAEHLPTLVLIVNALLVLLGVFVSVLAFLQFRVTRAPAILALALGFLLLSLATAPQLLLQLPYVADLALVAAVIAYASGIGCLAWVVLAGDGVARRTRHSAAAGGVGLAEELSQPLCAITANADAIGRLLDREQPDLDEVRAALADIVGDVDRVSDTLREAQQRLDGRGAPPAMVGVGPVLPVALQRGRGAPRATGRNEGYGRRLPDPVSDQ